MSALSAGQISNSLDDGVGGITNKSHLDLNAFESLLTKDWNVKIADFTLSKQQNESGDLAENSNEV